MRQWSLARSEKIPRGERGRPQGGEHMKKIFLHILLVSIMVLFFSCNYKMPTENVTTETTIHDAPTDSNSINFNDYDQYMEYLRSVSLPNDFVQYDKLRSLGSFEEFQFTGLTYNIHDQYYYLFLAENGRLIDLLITHMEEAVDYELAPISVYPVSTDNANEDLRYCQEKERCHYYLDDDLAYCYDQGVLSDIYLRTERVMFHFFYGYSASEFIPNDGSLVSRLLNKNTAPEAKAEFEAMVFGEE